MRNVRRPKLLSTWTFLMNPVRNLIEHMTTELPCMQIGRAPYLKLALFVSLARGKHIPRVSLFHNGGIMRALKIATECKCLWLLGHAQGRQSQRENDCVP